MLASKDHRKNFQPAITKALSYVSSNYRPNRVAWQFEKEIRTRHIIRKEKQPWVPNSRREGPQSTEAPNTGKKRRTILSPKLSIHQRKSSTSTRPPHHNSHPTKIPKHKKRSSKFGGENRTQKIRSEIAVPDSNNPRKPKESCSEIPEEKPLWKNMSKSSIIQWNSIIKLKRRRTARTAIKQLAIHAR